ncbi:MAG: lysophospholipid acyltransferase family protein [Candidatus Omnitrophica bacterium]|nr:lysophospholipid acyltransferase family protein [Candidatus Omnitrophota bacterium]
MTPRNIGYKVAEIASDIKRLLSPRDRRNVCDNLSVVLADQPLSVVRKHVKQVFRNFGKYLVDFFRYPLMDNQFLQENVTVVNRHFIDQAAEGAKGVIIVSAHFGNWELGAALMPYLGYTFNAIVLYNRNRYVNNFFVRQRQNMGANVILVGNAIKKSVQALKNNQILALVADWDFTGHAIEVSFFGRKTRMPKGPAILSVITGAPIVPGFVIRQKDDTFTLIFEKPLTPSRSLKQPQRIRELVEGYSLIFENYIRRYPDQWYAFRSYWRKQREHAICRK